MAEASKDEQEKNRQRGRHILAGALAALLFVLLGAWLAREFIIPRQAPESLAEIPDAGAPFDVVVPDLFKEDDRFYEDVLNHYYNHYVTAYKDQPHTYYNIKSGDLAGYSVPLAAVKTDELPNLASATARILGTIADKVNVPGSLDLTGVTYYGYNSGRKHAYDMKAVLERNAAASDYQVWVSSYDKAVPFGVYSQKWMTAFALLA